MVDGFIIVNADDFGLTPSVCEGILEASEKGIVTSTTCLINLEIDSQYIERAKKNNRLGIGLHLNIIFGPSVLSVKKVSTLVNAQGEFLHHDFDIQKINLSEVEQEFRAQIQKFESVFSQPPTHLDTHYHLHGHERIFDIVYKLANERHIFIRPREITAPEDQGHAVIQEGFGVPCVYGCLEPGWHWTEKKLLHFLKNPKILPCEIICHPGHVDEALKRVSRLADTREKEVEAFTSVAVQECLEKEKIGLSHYGFFHI